MGGIQDIFTRAAFTNLAPARGVHIKTRDAARMTLTDLTANVSAFVDRLKTRFPHIDEDTLHSAQDADTVITHVAHSHDLTRLEAHQELEDWLFVESLARQAGDLRAG